MSRQEKLNRLAVQYEANGHSVEMVGGLHAHLIVTDISGSRYQVGYGGAVKRLLAPAIVESSVQWRKAA